MLIRRINARSSVSICGRPPSGRDFQRQATHLLGVIDRFVDLSEVRSHLAPFYSSTGRPSIDPELLVRMLLVGYCYGIRSERRLCEEVHLNLAYRWFCRLGLDGEVPDHSTFSKNRHGRFRDCDLLRKLFETVVRRCMAEGLVDGAAFAVDASLIAADANKQRSAAGSDDVNWATHSFGPWLTAAANRLHHNVLATALANKLARIAWTVLMQARSRVEPRTA